MRGLFPISHPAVACSGIECYPYRLIFKGVIVAVHLLIVDALNLIRRIHAVQGSPCVETCQHALDQLIMHSQPTHAVAVFDDENRSSGWRHQRLPDYKAGRPPMPEELHDEMPALRAAFEQRGVPCWSTSGNEADDLAATLAVKVTQAGIRQRLFRQIKATVSYFHRHYVFVITSRNVGWMRHLSIKNLAFNRSSCPITGDLRGSAVQRYQVLRESDQKAPRSCWSSFRVWKGYMRIWMRLPKSGAKN